MTRGVYEITTRNPLLRQIFQRARDLGIGDRELGKLSGYSTTSIYYYRTGRKNGLRLATMRDWAQAVGLEVAITLTERKEP